MNPKLVEVIVITYCNYNHSYIAVNIVDYGYSVQFYFVQKTFLEYSLCKDLSCMYRDFQIELIFVEFTVSQRLTSLIQEPGRNFNSGTGRCHQMVQILQLLF